MNNAVIDIGFDEPTNAIAVQSVVSDMVDFAKALVVDSDVAYKKITSLYRQARDWKKCIETKRKEMTEPFRKQVSTINDKAKELTDPLDAVVEIANAKSAAYLQRLEEERKAEEARLRESAAMLDCAEELYIPPVETTVRGNGAISYNKKEMKFNVTDLSKVPLKYLMVDEAAVKRDMALGIITIPGLEIFETTTTKLRVR